MLGLRCRTARGLRAASAGGSIEGSNGIVCQREGGNLDQSFRRAVCDSLPSRRAAGAGRAMADPADHGDLPFPPGICDRHSGPRRGDVAWRNLRPAVRDGEPARRQRQYRSRRRRRRPRPTATPSWWRRSGPTVANKFMYKTMSYDPERAFVPVVMLGSSPLIIVGSPKIPPTNLKELVAYAKLHPGASSTPQPSGTARRRISRWS